MPEITRFNGIVIKMFTRGEHNPPHFHAIYNEFNSIIEINTLKAIEGDLPARQLKLVISWAKEYQNDLWKMWDDKEIKNLPPFNKE